MSKPTEIPELLPFTPPPDFTVARARLAVEIARACVNERHELDLPLPDSFIDDCVEEADRFLRSSLARTLDVERQAREVHLVQLNALLGSLPQSGQP